MKILIYGAGAIGSDVGGMLSVMGEDVSLLARGSQLQALQTNGLRVQRSHQPEQIIPVHAVSAQKAGGHYDLIVVTLKSMQLMAVARDLMDRLAPGGTLLMIQNGLPWWYFDREPSGWNGRAQIRCLDPQNILRETIALDCVVGAVIYRPVIQMAPGQIFLPQRSPPRLIVGEIDHGITDRLKRIHSLFERCGFDVELTLNIRLAKWQKLMVNLIWNPLCAVTQCSPGHIVENPKSIHLVRQLLAEGLSVAHRLNMPVEVDADREIESARGKFELQPSMWQDVRAGRPLEVDAILNSVVELADFLDVSTPGLKQLSSLLDLLNQSIIRNTQTQALLG